MKVLPLLQTHHQGKSLCVSGCVCLSSHSFSCFSPLTPALVGIHFLLVKLLLMSINDKPLF